MKTKKLVLNIFALLGLVLLILPMFLAMYAPSIIANGEIAKLFTVKIFGDWGRAQPDNLFFATLTDIFAVVMLCFAATYLVLFILQLAKVGNDKTLNKVKKLLAVLTLILTILSVATFVVFAVSNTTTSDFIKTTSTVLPQAGSILMVVGGLVFSVFGMVASKKK